MIQTLILDICATNSVETAKIYLIDPKFGVDYQNLEELTHLTEGIVIDQDRAAGIHLIFAGQRPGEGCVTNAVTR